MIGIIYQTGTFVPFSIPGVNFGRVFTTRIDSLSSKGLTPLSTETSETEEELKSLGVDIFSYFGLGCRNVSKLYLPKGYDLKALVKHWDNHNSIVSHTKYANNYDFNKAVYLVNKEIFYDTGYLLLKEESKISSPVSVLYYEYYESQEAVKKQTELLKEKIQCKVGKYNIPFGKAQSPHLWDYADGIDTIEFLLKKKIAGIL